jgi:predicted ATPase
VGEIRAALDDDAKHPRYLDTVIGRCYRFLEGAGGKAPIHGNAQPFVGRDAELRRLDDLYQLAFTGRTQFVLLAGEPGIGKTTLLNSFLGHNSRSHGVKVIQGQCIIHYGKLEAYGPMLEAIASFYRVNKGAGFIKDMERHAPAWLLQVPEMLDAMLFERVKNRTEGTTPERMTREFCQLVMALVERRPLIIVLEDLHCADVSTVDLLASLAEHSDLPLMILGTYRPADAVIYSQSLRNTIRELKGRGLCQELLLKPSTEADLTSYLATRLNGEVSQDLTAGLYPRTGGNPLFMVKLVEQLIRTQALVCHAGLWSYAKGIAAMEIDVPESLQALILRHLEALPQAQVEMLEVASAVGMEFSAAAIADALAKTIEEIESTCEKLSADSQFIAPGSLLTWPDGTLTGSYRFQHHLYLEVIYRQIAEARRLRIHRKIGERLEAGYGERATEIAASLAIHFDLGQDPERALYHGRLAAEQSLSRHAYLTAVDQLSLTLEHLEKLPESSERNQLELELLMLLGPVLIATGSYTGPGVASTYQRAIKLCELLEDPDQHFAALWNFAGYNEVILLILPALS